MGFGESIDSRVTAVETALTAQSGQIAELGADLHALQSRIETGFENIRASIYASRQTPWSVLVSAAGLIVVLSGLAVSTVNGVRGEYNAKFTEVETQFRGVSKEMQTQVDNNTRNSQKNFDEVEALRNTLNGVNGVPGLKERLARTEQKLDDHDAYLWPVETQQAKEQHDMAVEVGKNTAAIEHIRLYQNETKK